MLVVLVTSPIITIGPVKKRKTNVIKNKKFSDLLACANRRFLVRTPNFLIRLTTKFYKPQTHQREQKKPVLYKTFVNH